MEPAKINNTKKEFEIACRDAEKLSIIQNAGAAFDAVVLVKKLRELLTDEIMNEIFMPLMNTKIGFLTDRNGKQRGGKPPPPPYSVDVVRDAIIDAASYGLLPTFNQINIIASKMYPTKEGFTALLKKLKCKYILSFSQDTSKPDAKFAEIQVKINYEFQGDKNSFLMTAVVPKNQYSSYDQLKGKAERRAKKMLYEYLTGLDLGEFESDENSQSNIEEAEVVLQDEPEQKQEEPQGEPEKVEI